MTAVPLTTKHAGVKVIYARTKGMELREFVAK